MSRIQVTIDRLVLGGMDPAQRAAFVHGLKHELARTLTNPDVRAAWANSRRRAVLRLGCQQLDSTIGGARRLGSQVAKGIGRGLKP